MILCPVSCESVSMTKFILTDHATDWGEETLVTHAMNIMFWVAVSG